MQALPVPPVTRKKCYRELITKVIKEGHERWKHRNKQLSDSGELTLRTWSPKSRILITVPTPHKRKQDVAWSTQRITETNMQKTLHNFIHTTHTNTENIKTSIPSGHGDKTEGKAAKGNVWAGERALGTRTGGQGKYRRLRRTNHTLK
jgi:hypothetical protein